MGKPIRILVVDDHSAIRRGPAATLDPEPDMEVVGAVAIRKDAIQMWLQLRPDITLMDLALKGEDGGVEAIREIRKEAPGAKIIVSSVLTGDEDVYQALQSGAVTFITKDISDEELVQTIRDVHAGGRLIPPDIARKLAAIRQVVRLP
jgi:DNA-binding NarL/FixJ family response regulator